MWHVLPVSGDMLYGNMYLNWEQSQSLATQVGKMALFTFASNAEHALV